MDGHLMDVKYMDCAAFSLAGGINDIYLILEVLRVHPPSHTLGGWMQGWMDTRIDGWLHGWIMGMDGWINAETIN